MQLLSSFSNVLVIILGFGLLIFIHELGHFLAAKWAGIRAEAFAIGMGPVAMAWRRGIGLRFGSTAPEYEKRVTQFLATDQTHALSTLNEKSKPISTSSKNAGTETPQAEMYRIGDKLGLGETEYSLRWLPIGGFVKMLGQEDANPNYVSNDPRSYTMCPVGKRMIVVSAGVIMNLLLAIALFIFAFLVGVRLPAPVVGEVSQILAAGNTMAVNAHALGVTKAGLQPGDRVLEIDGKPARTFADLQIASAMGKPNVPVQFTVQRQGVSAPLEFNLVPQKDKTSGLLSVGVSPGSTATLQKRDDDGQLAKLLKEIGLADAGVKPGMKLARVNGQDVETYEQVQRLASASNGESLHTEWTSLDSDGVASAETIKVDLIVEPEYAVLRYASPLPNDLQTIEMGLLGLTPLIKLDAEVEGDNAAVLKKGDVILRVRDLEGPRMGDFRKEIAKHKRETIELLVLRDGEEVKVNAKVDGKGRLNVLPAYAWDLPLIAQPLDEIRMAVNGESNPAPVATPVANLKLMARTKVNSIGGVAVSNWPDIRRQLLAQTSSALASHSSAVIPMEVTLPLHEGKPESLQLELSPEQIASLHELSWQIRLPSDAFEPITTVLTANGNPLTAISMGFTETHKLVLLTYLTIDRLIRGSVGVEQLRGPVGIVHMGSKVADQGMLYMLFFLGMISVNLAVINFLPLPIVDGGLFLFLIYEKFKGRPPPLAFQNITTIIGIGMIVTMLIVVTWNDVMRLIS